MGDAEKTVLVTRHVASLLIDRSHVFFFLSLSLFSLFSVSLSLLLFFFFFCFDFYLLGLFSGKGGVGTEIFIVCRDLI